MINALIAGLLGGIGYAAAVLIAYIIVYKLNLLWWIEEE